MRLDVHVTYDDGTPAAGQLVTLNTARADDWGQEGITLNPNPRRTDGNGMVNFYNDPRDTPLAHPIAVQATCLNTTTGLEATFDGTRNVLIGVVAVPFKQPFQPAPRYWKGNMCGVRVPGVAPVDGGADDPSLVLSWFYDRYNAADRAKIRSAWHYRGYTHVLTSWADSRVFGFSPQQFRDSQIELIQNGFFPCPWLASKAYDSVAQDARTADIDQVMANIAPIVPLLRGVLPMACLGGELNLWMQPDQLRDFIDRCAPLWVPGGTRLYVHFSEGYSAWQPDGGVFADFWNLNVGKIAGVLHQKVLAQTHDEYYTASGGLIDILIRFAGNAGVVPDSGFGHPFDLVAMEITAQDQFNGDCTEDEGDALGEWAMACPAQTGPAGSVGVMGSGNGGHF